MSEERWISVIGWRKFQHYDPAKRQPPWIKVYTELLSDDDYLDLTGDQRAILHGLWLEYASSSCRLRLDTRSLSRRLGLRVTMRQLLRLNHAGYIAFVASKSLAEGYHSASPRASREETEAYRAETEVLSQVEPVVRPQAQERPDLDQAEEIEQEQEPAFASEPEPPLNGRTADEYGLQPLAPMRVMEGQE